MRAEAEVCSVGRLRANSGKSLWYGILRSDRVLQRYNVWPELHSTERWVTSSSVASPKFWEGPNILT